MDIYGCVSEWGECSIANESNWNWLPYKNDGTGNKTWKYFGECMYLYSVVYLLKFSDWNAFIASDKFRDH